jgi:uncharacterized protein (DUF488 family)
MRPIFSVGHSRHAMADFLKLLQEHGVKALVDVRSFPSSKIAPHFNRENLAPALHAAGISYFWSGAVLGGRGRESYQSIRQKPAFKDALRDLIRHSQERPTVLMCAEEDPYTCHRRFLITRSLLEDFAFINVQHIRKDGRLLEEPGFPESAVQLTLGL